MNKINYVIIFLSWVYCGFAQTEGIELPKVETKIGAITYPHFEIFVTKEGEIIYNGNTIHILQLKELLNEPIKGYPLIAYYPKQIHLFADKGVRYSLIDSIKTEISTIESSRYIIYRSNFEKKKKRDVKGIKHKSPLSFYKLMPPEYIRKEEVNEENQSEMFMIPERNDFTRWTVSVERAIYGIQQDVIDETINDKVCKCYSLSNKGLVEENVEISISSESLKKILENNDIVLLKYEKDLQYGNYIKFIEIFQELVPNFETNMHNYAEVIELSYQMQGLHKKAQIKLCDF